MYFLNDNQFIKLEKTKNWNSHFQNAAGHSYSNCYGFGVLNALSLVKKAKSWKHVGPQVQHEVKGRLDGRETREIKSGGNLVLKVTICFRFYFIPNGNLSFPALC